MIKNKYLKIIKKGVESGLEAFFWQGCSSEFDHKSFSHPFTLFIRDTEFTEMIFYIELGDNNSL